MPIDVRNLVMLGSLVMTANNDAPVPLPKYVMLSLGGVQVRYWKLRVIRKLKALIMYIMWLSINVRPLSGFYLI